MKELAKSPHLNEQVELACNIENMLMLIIDEQSMISLGLLAAKERYIRQQVYRQQNQNKLWGDIPVVLVFGDDYQLFPVLKEGTIIGFTKTTGLWVQKESKKSSQQ